MGSAKRKPRKKDLAERLREPGELRGTLQEAGGLRKLAGAIGALRPDAKIIVTSAEGVIALELREGKPVDAVHTSADGNTRRGPALLDEALDVMEGEFRAVSLDPDGRELARRADVAIGVLTVVAGMIAALLGIGGPPNAAGDASDGEARALAQLPPLTWSTVMSGEFTGGFEAYLADHFPLRRPLLGIDSALRTARGFPPGEGDVVVYSVSPEAIDLGADPDADLDDDEDAPLEEQPPRNETPRESREPQLVAPVLPAVPQDDEEEGPSRTRRVAAGILVRDGRAMQSFGGRPTGAPAYARFVNAVHRAVGERATVYSAIVPTAQEFYLPAGSRNRVRGERPNILATYARLSPGIRTVDIHAEIAAHTEEDVYFRTDHHWTGLGAYYAYRAFCEAAGLEPVPLERMERRVHRERWMGSLYRLTRDPTLRPDSVEIEVPPTRAVVHVPSGRGERVVPLFRDRASGYEVFLGGDHAIMRVRTNTRNGRRAILVKNSYGNAFAPYLVSHYEELVFVDYRLFHGNLLRLVDESEQPTDLIFMNGTLTANSRAHTAHLQRLLDGRG
jgi:hypothetical protein